ncbi:putative inactive leucine-rich repeat receptor-like protein kinase [Senna tora]|uniref:Putative inactive leucine-rich repeat receptor-like protein kinase n=1 Tax=Senna tora TaxID=362788 RepID=A0A834X4K8_9FABA|nr:putative inactive leucine-rich repeat receptor-like protein kinase [Senna tora]
MKPHMACHYLFFLSCFCFWCVSAQQQLQSSQTQVLLQIKKQLEYPKQLESWKDRWAVFCSSSSHVNVTCQANFVTELSIMGNSASSASAKARGDFDGFSIPNQTLSENFSMDSFVATLARLTNLKVLRLVSLGIWGPLPGKIHRLLSLEHLDLSSNFLCGSVPPKISTIVNLQILKLDDNFFNSTIPSLFLDSLTNLTVLDLSRNSLSGEIPKHYGSLNHLQNLDVSFNALTGKPPSELFSLPKITYLNLASNKLSGSFQNHVICSSKLRFVDISHNKLIGGLPSCLGTESENRVVVKCEGNCLSYELQHQHEMSYCSEVHVRKKKKKEEEEAQRNGVLIGVIVGVFVGVVILGLGFVVLCRRFCPRGMSEQHLLHKSVQDSNAASAVGFSSEILANARFISQASKLGREELPMCRPYSFEEIKEATNNFDNSTFMGENLYGKLYKGKLENGKQVAIRLMPLSKKYSLRNFKLRLDLLAKLRHPHLVTLLGHCIHGVVPNDHGTNVFLVYEFVSNGSFQTCLSGNSGSKVLNWTERLTVLISIAKAIHFLHTGMIPGFFKNRLKTNNILLDQHWIAKLSDYGLSIISEESDNCGGTRESPKSWEMKRLEDDVHSFGFILLEALVGPSVSAKREAILLNVMDSEDGWKQIVDPIVQAKCSKESLFVVISITNKCISPESWSRPSMEDVLWNLQYASQLEATADTDQRFHSASHH